MIIGATTCRMSMRLAMPKKLGAATEERDIDERQHDDEAVAAREVKDIVSCRRLPFRPPETAASSSLWLAEPGSSAMMRPRAITR